jgi:ssDNA-binding Zn-finger/Zn-ribbon topoisomerase 1
VKIEKLYGEQHFTQPPPRYSEASLVKALEQYGIGRPSTYASIISTLVNREYVTLDKKRFMPTDVGRVVNKFLTEHFAHWVDYEYTAKLEDELDDISNGKEEWVPMLEKFWKDFSAQIDEKESVPGKDVTQEQMDETCPKCGKHPLAIRLGRRGPLHRLRGLSRLRLHAQRRWRRESRIAEARDRRGPADRESDPTPLRPLWAPTSSWASRRATRSPSAFQYQRTSRPTR